MPDNYINNDINPEEIAAQLRKPEGEFGLTVADNLNESNINITNYVYDHMPLADGERVLEIGFGNGKLMDILLKKNPNIFLAGIDFSDTMVNEARTHHQKNIEAGRVEIKHAGVDEIPYPDNHFDKICHINTLYFWPNPIKCAQETLRVLKPGGSIYTGIRPEEEMKQFPFTQHGFTCYDEVSAIQLFKDAGFSHVIAHKRQDPDLEFNDNILKLSSICVVATK